MTDVVPKFGQARTPSWTIPSTIKARQTAYCSLRRKPRVPSIGSIVHDRPVGPPVCEPRSRAVSTLRDSGRVEVHRIKDVSRGQPFGSVRSRPDPLKHRNAASRHSPVLGERISLSPDSFALLAQLSLRESLVDEPDDLIPQPIVLAQLGRVLFADDLVLGEGVLEVKGDQSLSGEVSDYTGGFGVEVCWVSGVSSCASSR